MTTTTPPDLTRPVDDEAEVLFKEARRRERRRRLGGAAVVLALVSLAAGLVIGSSGGGPPHGSSSAASGGGNGGSTGGAGHHAQTLTEAFAVFRRSTKGQPPLPKSVGGWKSLNETFWGKETKAERAQSVALRKLALAKEGKLLAKRGIKVAPMVRYSTWGLERNDIQFVEVDGLDIWLIPGTRGVCMVIRFGGSSCAPVASAISGGTWVSQSGALTDGIRESELGGKLKNQPTTVIGLVPDANSTIKGINYKGLTREFPVKDNVFVATVRYISERFEFRNAEGQPTALG